MSVYHENRQITMRQLQLPTKRGARTITVDDQTHLIYLPTADFEQPDPNSPTARPKMIPGTFQVIVISQ
jgi:hypothetical protein